MAGLMDRKRQIISGVAAISPQVFTLETLIVLNNKDVSVWMPVKNGLFLGPCLPGYLLGEPDVSFSMPSCWPQFFGASWVERNVLWNRSHLFVQGADWLVRPGPGLGWLGNFPSIGKCGRRKWQPTPLFLPRDSCGQRSLVGCCP